PDTNTIYRVPALLRAAGLDDLIVRKFNLDCAPADFTEWDRVVDAKLHPDREVNIAIVGKYMELLDAYKSLIEAISHGGIQTRKRGNMKSSDSAEVRVHCVAIREGPRAILVPGGFGMRGVEGRMVAVQCGRETRIPYLGICLGMLVAVIEYARNVAALSV